MSNFESKEQIQLYQKLKELLEGAAYDSAEIVLEAALVYVKKHSHSGFVREKDKRAFRKNFQ